MTLYIPGSARTSIILVAATANQLALSVPFPELSSVESTVHEATELHNALYMPKWLYMVPTWKTILWCSTALELAAAYRLLDTTSCGLSAMTSLDDTTPLPIPAAVGLSILAATAATQVVSRLTLGRYSRFPILPVALTSQRPVHVPPSIAHSMSRAGPKIQPRPDGTGDAEEATCSLRSSHELVTDGPYGYVRHPMYSSFLLGGVGSLVFYSSSMTPLTTLFEATKSLLSRLASQTPYDLTDVSTFSAKIAWGKLGLGFAVLGLGVASLHLYGVARVEDDALGGRFGNQWKMYKWYTRPMFFYIPLT